MTVLVGFLLYTWEVPVVPASVIALCFGLPMALVGDSAKHMCRVLPLRRTRLSQVFPALLGMIVFASGTWTGLFVAATQLLEWMPMAKVNDYAFMLFVVGVLCLAFSMVFHYLVIAMEHARSAERSADEAKVLSREAELRALRAQLDPHFLFNSLNSVAALTMVDPTAAQEMVVRLSAFFRSTLAAGKQGTFTLGEGVSLLRNYREVEKVRFEDRLVVEERVDAELGKISLPPLLLQPLVENAIKHGVAKAVEAVNVRIAVESVGDAVAISICNDFDPENRGRGGTGIGLSTTRERLLRFYGERARMSVDADAGRFCVTIWIDREDGQ